MLKKLKSYDHPICDKKKVKCLKEERKIQIQE